MDKYVLETKDLCKKYGKSLVLNKLNMHVPKGAIYGFVGKNGAGKTTLIRLVCGLQYQNDGELAISGIKNTDTKINDIRKKFGAIIETPALHLNLSAAQNIELQLDALGIQNKSKINELLKFVGLNDVENKPAGNFSLGMRQRLAIAIALCGDPEFLVLDEPMNGLDPQGIIDMRELLRKLNQEKGITILISSHILDELEKVATHYGFISKGTIVSEISADELHHNFKKSMILTVNDTTNIDVALDGLDVKYEIDGASINIRGDITITDLVLALHKHSIIVENIISKEESLEEFFFDLIGGASNV